MIEGTWRLVVSTPIGRQEAEIVLSTVDVGWTGVARGAGEEVPLRDVAFDGTRLTWTQSITRPLRLNLAFDVAVAGDELTGFSRAGRLPKSTVVGHRVG
ncbi:hypothetical protein [Actinosynnema sp. NPDC020468]|uniref:hypothetical protein n=1 Tax=Actinosynnema sp. NPDC020468 TaxID=3154488 RepID=UPI00340B065B